jgi:hypothetical protein
MGNIITIDGETFYTDYDIPEDDSVIWRFLDLAKFISLLKDSALYMTRADKFEDRFEGAVCAEADSDKYDEALSDYYSNCQEGYPVSEQLIQNEHKANQLIRRNSFLSCWFEGTYESIAMWRLYASGKEAKGVAIKTTVGQLKKAIEGNVEIGRIKYIDYSKEWPNTNEALWRKRLSFEYEREVRVRVMNKGGLSPTPPNFLMLPVNLNELIEAVYVSPMSESWFKDVVADVMRRYGVDKEVHHSALDDKAVY